MSFEHIGILLIKLPRTAKKLIVFSLDICIAVFATWLAFCLRFDDFVGLSQPLIWAIVASVFICLPIFVVQGLYRAIFRYAGWFATFALIRALTIYAAIYILMFTIIGVEGVPRSIGLVQPIILFVCVGVLRLLVKALLNLLVIGRRNRDLTAMALIYGAGAAGRQLASGLRQSEGIKPVAFVDDDSGYWNSTINGLRVYAPDEIPGLLASNLGVTDVLLAIPSASRMRQREILKRLSNLPVHVRILPGLAELANGDIRVEDFRDVEIEDILGRETVQANTELLHQNIADKIVMVTGAGGSIGSELCRQVLIQNPKILVLLEQGEFSLYSIEQELTRISTSVKIIPILGSVLDSNKLERVIQRFGVQTVYHAAAYKHVPMIEMNPAAGIWNNVFGTLRTVEASCRAGVETFVLISTDKAVRPTNVMGCSKRIAELVVQAKSLKVNHLGAQKTKLTMVRFGNVLGSSGSVVPLFREQIRNGGPITVTHPEIIRYFMTIPEAAQLVIQAGAIGEAGDVMVLDMGEPIKILDLAKRMIHLSGFSHRDEESPDGDIEIEFTGLRPGEKLYEELLIGDNSLSTEHPRIMRAAEHALTWEELEPIIVELESAVKAEHVDVIKMILKKAVPEFNPQTKSYDALEE